MNGDLIQVLYILVHTGTVQCLYYLPLPSLLLSQRVAARSFLLSGASVEHIPHNTSLTESR